MDIPGPAHMDLSTLVEVFKRNYSVSIDAPHDPTGISPFYARRIVDNLTFNASNELIASSEKISSGIDETNLAQFLPLGVPSFSFYGIDNVLHEDISRVAQDMMRLWAAKKFRMLEGSGVGDLPTSHGGTPYRQSRKFTRFSFFPPDWMQQVKWEGNWGDVYQWEAIKDVYLGTREFHLENFRTMIRSRSKTHELIAELQYSLGQSTDISMIGHNNPPELILWSNDERTLALELNRRLENFKGEFQGHYLSDEQIEDRAKIWDKIGKIILSVAGGLATPVLNYEIDLAWESIRPSDLWVRVGELFIALADRLMLLHSLCI